MLFNQKGFNNMKNKNVRKRMAAVLLSGCMIMASLAGCGNTENKQEQTSQSVVEESSATQSVTTETSKPEKIEVANLTYWCQLGNSATLLTNLNEMPIIQEACEKNYVNIEFFHPAASAAKEQFNLKIASGEYEDIIEYTWKNYPGGPAQAITDGVIIDLKPYIDAGYAPNFKKALDENPAIAKQIVTDDGQIYCFPAIGDASVNVTSGFMFRQDMLDKLGMEVPETIAEWETVLTAMKEQLGVEKPFSGQSTHLIGSSSYLAGAFDTYSGFYVRDGKVQYGFMDESYKEYITTMNRWYEAGLIDQEIFGNESSVAKTHLLNDRSGAFFGYLSTISSYGKAAAETNPSFKLVGANYPVLEEGQTIRFVARAWDARLTNNVACITTACEDVEAAVRYLDFWYGEEGHMMKNFGTEGLSYNMVDGYPTYTDLILKNPDGHSISAALGGYTRGSEPTVGFIDRRYYEQYYELQDQVDAMILWNENANNALEVLMPVTTPTGEEAEELAVIENALKTYVEEELTKFIIGIRDMNEYDSFVETLKTMNVQRAIEIKQAAYDRYMAR